VRDAVVTVLLIALAVLDPLAVIIWVVVAFVGRRLITPRRRVADAGRMLAWLGVLALLGVIVLVKAWTGLGLPRGDTTWWPSLAIAVALLVLIAGDLYLGRTYLRRRFRSHSFTADHTKATSWFERRIRGIGLARYATQLARFADADEHSEEATGKADVVVHRGETPFVGAGYVLPRQSLPIALRPAVGRKDPLGDIRIWELYDRITAELAPPRATSVPAGHVAAVTHREQLLVLVDDLIRQRGTPFGMSVLLDLDAPPVRHLPLDQVRAAAEQRIEWARYYSCFRTESWNRKLVTSFYLHLTARSRTLVVDVTPCVLPPPMTWLDEADKLLAFGDGPLLAGSLDLLQLPFILPKRLSRSWSSLRPRRLRTRGIASHRYGAGGSLREGVSPDSEEKHFFTNTDASNQISTMHNELFAVVSDYLEERGYDISELSRRAATMIENHTMNINNSSFAHSTINNGAVNPPPKPTPTPEATPAAK
jgi:hypothetical protein